jgi:hypothetical protein
VSDRSGNRDPSAEASAGSGPWDGRGSAYLRWRPLADASIAEHGCSNRLNDAKIAGIAAYPRVFAWRAGGVALPRRQRDRPADSQQKQAGRGRRFVGRTLEERRGAALRWGSAAGLRSAAAAAPRRAPGGFAAALGGRRIFPCIPGGCAYLSRPRRTRTCLWPMVVMQRRNASFLAVRPDGRSREGGRYGCNPAGGRRALP